MSRYTTHTYVVLELSPAAFKEISDKLKQAGYGHAFMPNGAIDMHGIAVASTDRDTNEKHQQKRT